MPEMDGLEALTELRKTYPKLPVIMFSSLTERGAAETLDALARGATDYFTKPTDAGGLEGSLRVIREQMIPMIKAICAAHRKPSRFNEYEPWPDCSGAASGGDRTNPGFGHRNFDRRSERPVGDLHSSAGRLPGADLDRSAHATHVHADAG